MAHIRLKKRGNAADWEKAIVLLSCSPLPRGARGARKARPLSPRGERGEEGALRDLGSRMQTFRTARGRSLPLGATALVDGVNFALLCRHGTAVSLVLYPLETAEPLAEIALDPR